MSINQEWFENAFKQGATKQDLKSQENYEAYKTFTGSQASYMSYVRRIQENYKDLVERGLIEDTLTKLEEKNSEFFQAPKISLIEQYPDWTEESLYDLLRDETEKRNTLLKASDLKEISEENNFPMALFKEYWKDTASVVREIHKNLGLGIKEKIAIQKLKDKIKILEIENKKLVKMESSNEKVLEILEDAIREYEPFTPPKPYLNTKKSVREGLVILSDWHVDETVLLEEMLGINEYSLEIAKDRIHRVFDQIIENGKLFEIDTINLDFIGDMISGNLHDLAENAQTHVVQQVVMTADWASQQIQRLSGHFKTIKGIGLSGNHSRLHKKPYFKHKNQMNFEFFMYEMIRRSTDKVMQEFIIPESAFYVRNVNGTPILDLHGDQIRGGSGLNSVPGNLSRDISLLDGVLSANGKTFKVVNMGHYHSFNNTSSFSGAKIIMNSSLIGGNEFSINAVKKSEEPGQTFYILDAQKPGKPQYIQNMTV